jgi:sigma-B regulation protein RsbU (phosphoserine phosphatase)
MAEPASMSDRHPMQCMEIWGGNQAVESAVSTPGLDVWVSSRPYRGEARGGDVHYVSLCGGGVITRMIVADVSGHGEAVAEFSGSLRTLVRKNINRKNQTRLVARLNQQFTALAQLRRFATAVVATYLADRDHLSVCNAGHPRPFRYRAATGEWEVLTSKSGGHASPRTSGGIANLPLGLDDETPYDQLEVVLGRGDLVVIYTDALSEASDPGGRMLGEPGLLELVRDLDAADPIGLGPAILDRVAAHRAGLAADDDVTLLVLHHNAGPIPRLSIAEKLDVYSKVFGLKRV